jgi:hypothetical protein
LGTFEPIETVAMILGTQAYSTGTMITQAFSPGAIVTLPGITAASVAYDQSTGWSATAGDLALMQLGDAVYDSMLKAAAASVAKQMAQAQARWQRLGGGGVADIVKSVSWNTSAFATAEKPVITLREPLLLIQLLRPALFFL